MDFSGFSGIPDIPEALAANSNANVEDMSNAELFQYLFKAELDTNMPSTETPFLQQSSSVPSTPSSSSSSSIHNGNDTSPALSLLSFDSTPSAPSSFSLEQHQLQQQDNTLLQPLNLPTLLPSTSFSYRQISPDMPPSMPAQSQLHSLGVLSTTSETMDAQAPFQNLALAATGATLPSSSSASVTVPPEHMSFWMHRIQQLQQLQQIHHQQQQQLLTSTLFSTSNDEKSSQTGSGRSISPSSPTSTMASTGSPDVLPVNDVIYPSPPMKDDMSMDSDSDNGPSSSQRADSNGADPLKPSPSELKKMTSKERRQLRNKLSARNFRVRRKEYIGSLEAQVKEARREAAELQKKLAQSELNCQFLRQELETVRLSQTLFIDGRMPKEHANLLASLLNPNTETFPTTPSSAFATTSSSSSLASVQQQEQQQKEIMDSINHNNMTILNNSIAVAQTTSQTELSTTSTETASQGSLQPFVPFDGNWELIVNRAETIIDPVLDPKDVQSKEAVYHDLLARYEAAKQEAEVDEQMRNELKAYHEQKLAQTYIVMPKDDPLLTATNRASQDTLLLQTMVYMMMIHLTKSMFEAATLSKKQLVSVYKNMDEPLRSKMGQEQQERRPCKFVEWREAWIRKCWPSFYNNRQRVCELLKNGLSCPLTSSSSDADMDETVRRMEEGVKGKTVAQPSPLCLWICSYIPDWLKCPDMRAREEHERQALLNQESSSEVVA
ncbi:hypothetical protein BGZ51_003930 [Haplosporangium sp. Z 767]|nr:hypothetical protein BGZ51_003930 [Haplosporangium sp. Z 767]KAF9193095.1 hypothetical protein BGZ50_007781 [Haplosporangium sp. Z 11]